MVDKNFKMLIQIERREYYFYVVNGLCFQKFVLWIFESTCFLCLCFMVEADVSNSLWMDFLTRRDDL